MKAAERVQGAKTRPKVALEGQAKLLLYCLDCRDVKFVPEGLEELLLPLGLVRTAFGVDPDLQGPEQDAIRKDALARAGFETVQELLIAAVGGDGDWDLPRIRIVGDRSQTSELVGRRLYREGSRALAASHLV